MKEFRNSLRILISRSPLRALRHRDFALAELAGWFSGGGFWFYKIGLGILTWELTESGFWLAFIALSDAVPAILLSPIAGAVVDRYDRLVVGRIVQASIMVVTAILAWVTLAGWANLFVLVALAASHGISAAFWMPLRMAIAPTLVPKEDLAAAIAIHSTLFNLARFLFPALAIPVLAKWGVGVAFAVNAVGYSFYLMVLFMIRIVNPDEKANLRVGMLANLKEGLIYSLSHPTMKYLLLMLVVTSVCLHSYMEILPGITKTLFGRDPREGVAILVSAAGFGAIFSSLAIGNLSRTRSVFIAYFLCLFLSVLSLFLLGSTTSFGLGIAVMVLVSGAQMGMIISGQIIVQSAVEGSFRGRVMSLWALGQRAGPAFGALILGTMADFIGFQWPIILGAAAAALMAVFVYTHRQEMYQAAMR
ncbi:MAG: MFS transporter [Rhodospirillales bacterium]|nr:MFS transporter [Rhodospirillales bacterium]